MRIPALLLALLLSSPAYAYKVIGIQDGDTLTILKDRKEVKLRFAGVDAPEKAQAFGHRSRQNLSDLCFGKDAVYEYKGKHWDRIVATISCDGVDVLRAQLKRGMAMVDPRYNRDPSLLPLQEQAKEARRGLWADPNPVPPWEFRRRKVSNEKYDASQL